MASAEEPDMSAYPVLRLDQLPRHRDETLRRGLVDGRALLASLIAENSDDHRSMIRYLTKQLDGMTAELLKRNANSRIEQMISGSSASLSSDFSVLDSAKGSPRMPTPRRDSAAQPPQSAPPALPSSAAPPAWQVPLPSQIRREDAGGDSLAVQAPFGRRKRQSNDSGTGDGDVPSLATSRSVPLLDQNIGGVQTRLTNGVNPSRQSLVALNNAFGVSFVVGATERKRRHVPKKVVVNPEEDMEKSRQNRRKVAMQRLLERQSARKNQNEKLRMKKLLQRSKQKEPTPSNGSLAADLDDASDVESISGGDDDDEDANGALELVSPTETSCSVVDLQPQAVFSDRVLSVAKSEGIDNVIKPISASSAPNLVESVPGTNQPAVEGASFTVLDEVELTCDTVSLSSEMLIVNPDSFPRVVEPMCDTVSLLSEMLIANPDSCPIVENWTDNAELLQKNKSAWLTIQRLKSSKSIKLQISEQTPVGSCITTSIESPYESNQPELASQELCASPCTGDSSAGDGDIQRRKLCLDNINPIAGNNEPEIALCKSGEKYEAIDFVTNASAANAINPSESEDEDEVGWHIQPQPAQVRSSPKENFIKESTKERQIGAPLVGKRLVKGSDDVRPRLYDSFDMIFCAAYGPDGTNRFVRKGEAVAASTLYQSMKAISKLYEEWMEVMEDYATVFNSDNSASVPVLMNSEDPSQSVYKGGTKALHYRMKSTRVEVCNLITDVFGLEFNDWEELPSGLGLGLSWNFLWSWGRPRLNFDHLLVWQKVNHFNGSGQLTRKDMLKRNLQSLTEMGKGKKSGEFFEIMPLTFLLPAEYNNFVKTFHEIEGNRINSASHNIWIMKPIGLSRGRGISMVTDANSLTYSQASVLQRYVDRPLCLDGYKFDLRLYILVTSFCPLEAFIYKEGFARLSTHKYSTDSKDIHDKFVHLTNSSIQKQNNEGPSKDNPLLVGPPSDAGGSKISLHGNHGLWSRLKAAGMDVDEIWKNVCTLIVKSLVAVDDKIEFQPSCFEVYGYDVLIDENLRPWLIEVNASPSMARENYVDIRVKNAMIKDTVKLLNPAPFDRAALLKVMKRRLKQVASSLHQPAPSSKNDPDLDSDLRAILGDYIPRKYGEEPAYYGDYERLCPNTKAYEQAIRFKSKIFNRTSNP